MMGNIDKDVINEWGVSLFNGLVVSEKTDGRIIEMWT